MWEDILQYVITFAIQYGAQILSTIGIIYLSGVIIYCLRRIFVNMAGELGTAVELATSIVGTPVHESGHAIFCLIFGHKILEFKPYKPNPQDGMLGYVCHVWDKTNWYQKAGNFFIGVAPIILGMSVMAVALRLLLPDTFNTILESSFYSGEGMRFTIDFKGIVSEFIDVKNFVNYKWWIFIAITACLSFHTDLSGEDVKLSLNGLWIVLLAWFVVSLVLYIFVPFVVVSTSVFCIRFGIMVALFFVLSVVVDLGLTVVTFIIKSVFGI